MYDRTKLPECPHGPDVREWHDAGTVTTDDGKPTDKQAPGVCGIGFKSELFCRHWRFIFQVGKWHPAFISPNGAACKDCIAGMFPEHVRTGRAIAKTQREKGAVDAEKLLLREREAGRLAHAHAVEISCVTGLVKDPALLPPALTTAAKAPERMAALRAVYGVAVAEESAGER